MHDRTIGDIIDGYADRHGWIIDWERRSVRMPKKQARYWYPALSAIDRVMRFVRVYGGVLWCIALACVCLEQASRGSWHMALLSALLFGARSEQELHPKAKYTA